jgi:putative transcriptional regulator
MLNRISEVLQGKKLKQVDLAHELGVVKSTVSMWCSNKSQPPLQKLSEVARVLEVDITELLVTSKKKNNARKTTA